MMTARNQKHLIQEYLVNNIKNNELELLYYILTLKLIVFRLMHKFDDLPEARITSFPINVLLLQCKLHHDR